MTPKWSEFSSSNHRELSSLENGECKSAIIETIPLFTSSFGLPTANRMCSLSSQKKDGTVYKRRKMDKDSDSLAAYEEAKESVTHSCTTSKDFLSSLKPDVPSQTMVLSSKAGTTDPIVDNEEHAGVPSEQGYICMVSTEKKDVAECSSSNIGLTEPITELESPRDICIAILKKGLKTGSRTRLTTEELTDSDANPLLACNSCGGVEHLLKMLMCDSCEAAFHLSCCISAIEELPADEWFCKTCSLMKPKSLYGKLSEGKVKPSGNTNGRPQGMSHIEFMLKDTEQYVSGARISRDFQAGVPEWSGPISSTDGYFDEPSELDPAELTHLNRWETSNVNRASIGNWIQCQERLNFGDSDKICGKWRRHAATMSHGAIASSCLIDMCTSARCATILSSPSSIAPPGSAWCWL